MLHEEVFQRLAVKHPEAVMVRATLEQALPPSLVDEVFDRVASRQYKRKLLFSTLVRLLSLTAMPHSRLVNWLLTCWNSPRTSICASFANIRAVPRNRRPSTPPTLNNPTSPPPASSRNTKPQKRKTKEVQRAGCGGAIILNVSISHGADGRNRTDTP